MPLPTTYEFGHWASPEQMIALWPLSLLKEIDGDATYGDTTAVGQFDYATNATLSEMIEQLSDFWSNPIDWAQYEDFVVGALVGPESLQGWSTTTPKDHLVIYGSGAPDAAWWDINGSYGGGPLKEECVSGVGYAFALRGWYEAHGYDSVCQTMYEWLRSTSNNPINAIPDDTSESELAETWYGTYNPNIALGELIKVFDEDGNAVNECPNYIADQTYTYGYRFVTAGLLAPIQAARNPGDLTATVNVMSIKRDPVVFQNGFGWGVATTEYSPGTRHVSIQMLDLCGLNYQVGGFHEWGDSSEECSYDSSEALPYWATPVARAAIIGDAYRHVRKGNSRLS